jgi:hypothetical protein
VTSRALAAGAALAALAAVALGALALALYLSADRGGSHYSDAYRADVSGYVLVFLGIGLAAAAHATGHRSRLAVVAAAASSSAALGTCIAGVAWAYRARALDVLRAYEVVSFARTLAFTALVFAVLGALAWRAALSVAALLAAAGIVFLVAGLIASSDPLLSLSTTLVVLAAAAAFSARPAGAEQELRRR